MYMGLRTIFLYLFSQEKRENSSVYKTDPSLICVDQDGKYELLSEIFTLRDVSILSAKGTWGQEDFSILKEKIRDGLPSGVANVVLREVDMKNVKLDSSCDCIDFKKLFSYCVNLSKVVLPDASSYGGKAGFRATFLGCSKLKEIYNLSTYRHISDLRGTFCYCTLLSSVELFSIPLPLGDSDTFQKVNRDIRVIVPRGVRIPSDWAQLNAENIVYENRVFSDSLSVK